jgi:hypothetical protein
VDAVNLLCVVLVILTSLVVADLLLSTVFLLMDLAEPHRTKSLWPGLRGYLAQVLSVPGAHASPSRD